MRQELVSGANKSNKTENPKLQEAIYYDEVCLHGVSLKQLRAYAASSAALSRGRYIMMSLAPLIPGIIFLAVFVVCPISMKWLMTICVVPSFMGLISPAPDYMDVLIILRKVPKGAMIQATENGLVWYL